MKTNIKVLGSLVAAIMISLLSGVELMAQPGGQQGPPPLPNDKQINKMVKEITKECDLSDEQADGVSELYFAHFSMIEEEQESGTRISREQMQEYNKELQTEVKELLDDDQEKLYTAYLKEQEKNRGGGGQRPQGGQRPPR